MDFVLVHGAYHGAWCWSLVEPELARRGHRVTSVELPISDPSAGLTTYRDTIIEAAAGCESPVVVGHSMSGAVIPLVAEARPVSGLVFLAAFIPSPGTSLDALRSAEPIETYRLTTREFEELGDGVWMLGENSARELFYHDLDDEASASAYRRLRPQSYGLFGEPSPLAGWPDVPSSYILCREDRCLDPAWSRTAARDRLGTTALEIDGGHSPFLTRPAELAQLLELAGSMS